MNWVRAVKETAAGEIIAIDGKTVRGSFDARSGGKAIQSIVERCSASAWAATNRMVFAQVKTEEKAN